MAHAEKVTFQSETLATKLGKRDCMGDEAKYHAKFSINGNGQLTKTRKFTTKSRENFNMMFAIPALINR